MKLTLAALLLGLTLFGHESHALEPIPTASFGFESGKLSDWKLTRLPRPNSALVISSPARYGKRAAAVTLRSGETYGDAWKSELTDRYFAPFDREIWYRVSHYLPLGFVPEKGNNCILAQWHNIQPEGWAGGSPPLAHYLSAGKLRAFVSFPRGEYPGAGFQDLFKIALPRGVWHDFVYRTVWSRSGRGEIDAWYNGKFMGSYRGPLGYPSDVAGPYFKTGVYCEQSPVRPLTAYVDEYRRGPTALSVLLPGEKIEGGR